MLPLRSHLRPSSKYADTGQALATKQSATQHLRPLLDASVKKNGWGGYFFPTLFDLLWIRCRDAFGPGG